LVSATRTHVRRGCFGEIADDSGSEVCGVAHLVSAASAGADDCTAQRTRSRARIGPNEMRRIIITRNKIINIDPPVATGFSELTSVVSRGDHHQQELRTGIARGCWLCNNSRYYGIKHLSYRFVCAVTRPMTVSASPDRLPDGWVDRRFRRSGDVMVPR